MFGLMAWRFALASTVMVTAGFCPSSRQGANSAIKLPLSRFGNRLGERTFRGYRTHSIPCNVNCRLREFTQPALRPCEQLPRLADERSLRFSPKICKVWSTNNTREYVPHGELIPCFE